MSTTTPNLRDMRFTRGSIGASLYGADETAPTQAPAHVGTTAARLRDQHHTGLIADELRGPDGGRHPQGWRPPSFDR